MSETPALKTEELLTRALAGDAAAFAMLVRAQQRSVYSLALRMLSDRQKAEDLAQEVFLQLHRNLASVESGSVALAVSLVIGILVARELQLRRTQRGLEARAELLQALKLTGEKLDIAYRVVNDEEHAEFTKDSGV